MKGTRDADLIVADGSIAATRRDTSFAATQAINAPPKVNRSYTERRRAAAVIPPLFAKA